MAQDNTKEKLQAGAGRVRHLQADSYDMSYFLGADYEKYAGRYDYFIDECTRAIRFGGGAIKNIADKKTVWQRFVDIIEPCRDESILDIGCGWGGVSLMLAMAGAHVFALDYSPDSVRITKDVVRSFSRIDGSTRPTKAFVIQANAKELPFSDRSFDKIVVGDVVEHLCDDELRVLFSQIARVMKSDGRFYIHTAPNSWYDRYGVSILACLRACALKSTDVAQIRESLKAKNIYCRHVNVQNVGSLRHLLKEAGFKSRVWVEGTIDSKEESARRPIFSYLAQQAYPLKLFFAENIYSVSTAQPR